jgi:predicted transcriptional regulator
MVTITLELSEAQWERVQALANHYDLSPQQLLALSFDDWMNDRELEFRDTIDRVLMKNAELYDRLA